MMWMNPAANHNVFAPMIDRFDQPDNPRIRTKVNLLPDDVDEHYLNLIRQFADQHIPVETYLQNSLDCFHESVMGNGYDDLVTRALEQGGQFELLRRHIDEKRYTVLFYNVAANEVHAPHQHHNVASTQILVSGKLHLREYDRAGRDDDGRLLVRLVSDRVLLPGDTFQASEWKNNIHWFQALEGPALIFNTNARGFEPSTFDAEAGRFGRLYIDPTARALDGVIVCDEFGSQEAYGRFGSRALADFPIH